MEFQTWLTIVLAVAVLLVISGLTILTVISYSMTHGMRARTPLIAAITSSDCTALTLSMAGLGALLVASAFWFQVVKRRRVRCRLLAHFVDPT